MGSTGADRALRTRTDSDLFLRKGVDIERAKRTGERLSCAYFNLIVAPSDAELSKVAIVVGKKLGRAVVRNRAKRRFRVLARAIEGQLRCHRHLIVFPRTASLSASFSALNKMWRELLDRGSLLDKGKGAGKG
ncbi:MAG: ribonuclease P protein component [Nitrospiraceae bacterium]